MEFQVIAREGGDHLSVGYSIKEERLKQQMKQITLAKGICSTSYLSKIESELIVPSKEITELLLKRLNTEIQLISIDEEQKFITDFYEVYKRGIQTRDKKFIRNRLHEISYANIKIVFSLKNHFFDYSLYMFRLLMILDEDEDKLLASYENLLNISPIFNDKQKFIFNLNSGLYYFLIGKYQVALKSLESSLEFINLLDHEEWEKADFYNVLSMTYFKNYEYYNSINYANKSLQYYKDNLLFKRAIDGYIVIGAAHKNIKEYKIAEQSYNLAKTLAIEYALTDYEGIVYQNLGNLFAIQDNHLKSVEYFNLSLKCQESNYSSDGYLLTLLSIVKECSKLNIQEQVVEWCKRGLERIETERLKTKRNNLSYYYHFSIYRALEDSLEIELVIKKAIKHFENIQDYRHVHKYSMFLANHYFNEKKFKAAGLFYQKANQVVFIQKSIAHWEDL
jgi:tetratricopeptide (TPR) repeat protein